MNTINYCNIYKTIDHFTTNDFVNIEVPWMATEEILNITKPEHVTSNNLMIQDKRKGLLASGEQGFLYLVNKGFLQPGKYITTTPCFRNDVYDFTHSKQFLKVEAIDIIHPYKTRGDIENALRYMVNTAMNNFRCLTNKELSVENINIVNGINLGTSIDINMIIDGVPVEIGSYGIRHTSFCTWVYGTAIAEPRFSKLDTSA